MSQATLTKAQTEANIHKLRNTVPRRWKGMAACQIRGKTSLQITIRTHGRKSHKKINDVFRYLTKVKEGKSYRGLKHFGFILEKDYDSAVNDTRKRDIIHLIGKTFQNLEHYRIELKATRDITLAAEELIKQIGSTLKHTKHLHLDFALASKSLAKSFIEEIQRNLKFTSYRSFTIPNFPDYESDKLFSKSFKWNRVPLESHSIVEQRDIKMIMKTVLGTQVLQSISSSFERIDYLRAHELPLLALDIGSRLLSTRELSLDFSRRTTGSSFNQVTEKIISHFKLLRCLSLSFDETLLGSIYSNCMNDNLVRKLITGVGLNLKFIEKLSLSFTKCQNISRQPFEELAVQFETNFQELRNLSIAVPRCDNIKDDSVEQLILQAQLKLKLLEDLSFNFMGCGIKTKTLKFIAEQVSMMPQIQSFSLFDNLFTETENNLKNLLKGVPSVRIATK